jgi:pSer/pThr/pTyr-binding forkhead associated (FHA) protein
MREIVIGRDQGCDVVVNDPSVSRKHAKLIVTNGDLHVLSDFGSKHGTFIKEGGAWKQVSSVEVKRADQIRLGMHISNVADILRSAEASGVERNPDTGEIIPRRT